ncbi:sensor domain-containing diguanylate cyclase [Lacrimispora indolis]|uniref:sensor domain-containing diguanylate cyclase n=1 Tax=Lacrimispora indolis TaxID=69825 RepID=UPI0004144BFA|nr:MULTISPECIES: sensor domain-containing diguanylate cyclase [Lachnospiraceae]MBE7718113.1 diguanylate cyclase [Lacrimispora celerecrescens]
MNEEPFLDRIPCGILKLKTDEDLTILYSNQAIKDLFQAPASLKDMVCESEFPELLEEIRSHFTDQPVSFDLEFKAKIQKNCVWCSLQLNYIPEEELLYCAISDITCMKKFQEHLRIREEQYRLASQHSGCLVSIYDIPSRTLSPSPEFSRTFPFPYTMPLSPEFLIENGIVHKESVTDFLDFYDDMEKGVPEGKCITRLKTGSGDYHWFSTHYSLVCTEDQRPLRGIISYQDITDQYEKELAYQKWMEYMREQKKDCIGYYEYNLKFDLFEEIIGEMTQTMPEYVTNSFSSIMNYIAEHYIFEEDREMYLKFFNKNQLLYHYYRGNRSLRLEHRRLRPDGSVYWGLGLVQIVSDPYTDTIKAFILIKDIDAAKREALTLQELSKQDSLTGLLNRATAIHAIRSTLKDSQSHHILIMLDIDRFKQLNDNYGHHFGDKALHRAASRLKSALRRDDIFGRLGGDEFIILLKDVAYSMDLYARLENLCSLIGSALEPEAHISASLGTAAYPEDGTVFEELYQKADIALYHAKKHGRSQYAVYEPGMSMTK